MALFGFFLCAQASAAAPLAVVVTIKPIHSLAASILEGASEPKLLLKGAASPHTYALKPSDAEALSKADVIIRVSPNLEVFLDRTVRTLPAKARVIDLDRTPGLRLLPARNGILAAEGKTEGADEPQAHDDETAVDLHFWLDPTNAAAVARWLASIFSEMDSSQSALYHANAERLMARLAALDDELRQGLKGLSQKPFVVFHDVTQYFEKRYDLRGIGAITVSPEREPGAARLALIRAKIKNTQAICVFSEPQFPPKLVHMLTEGTTAKQGTLDEVGASIPAGSDQYFELLRANARHLASCLES